MSAAAAGFDRAAARALAWAETPGASEPAESRTHEALRTFLLLHVCARVWAGAYDRSAESPDVQVALGVAATLCFAAGFHPRLARAALAGCACVVLGIVVYTFPFTSNHAFLELSTLCVLTAIGWATAGERRLGLAACRWLVAIVLFWSGLQKLLHGSYFDGRYLGFEIATKASFTEFFSWLLPAAELERLGAMHPGRLGAGPFSIDAPLFLVLANSVWVFEMLAPLLLFWSRTRHLAAWGCIAFVFSIQAGAREFFFALLMTNLLLLYAGRPWGARLLPVFYAFYLYVLAMQHLPLPEFTIR